MCNLGDQSAKLMDWKDPSNCCVNCMELVDKQPVAPFSVRAFCTISSSSGPLKVHFVWEALSVFCSACTK